MLRNKSFRKVSQKNIVLNKYWSTLTIMLVERSRGASALKGSSRWRLSNFLSSVSRGAKVVRTRDLYNVKP